MLKVLKVLLVSLSALTFVACSNGPSAVSGEANEVLGELAQHLSEEDQQTVENLPLDLSAESISVVKVEGQSNAFKLEIAGLDLLVEFMNKDGVAMLVNGLPVALEELKDAKSFDDILAVAFNLVGSHLNIDGGVGATVAPLARVFLNGFLNNMSGGKGLDSIFDNLVQPETGGGLGGLIGNLLGGLFGGNDKDNNQASGNSGFSWGGVFNAVLRLLPMFIV